MKVNYSKEEISNEYLEVIEGIECLKMYLQSSKFDCDTTVQAKDVLARLAEITRHIDAGLQIKDNLK
jgi:hypothetical protein